MKLNTLTWGDAAYLDNIRYGILQQLKSLGLRGWKVQFVDTFEEKFFGKGWTSAATKRMQFKLGTLAEEPDHEVRRVILHEIAHAILETRGLPEGEDAHGPSHKGIEAELQRTVAKDRYLGRQSWATRADKRNPVYSRCSRY